MWRFISYLKWWVSNLAMLASRWYRLSNPRHPKSSKYLVRIGVWNDIWRFKHRSSPSGPGCLGEHDFFQHQKHSCQLGAVNMSTKCSSTNVFAWMCFLGVFVFPDCNHRKSTIFHHHHLGWYCLVHFFASIFQPVANPSLVVKLKEWKTRMIRLNPKNPDPSLE